MASTFTKTAENGGISIAQSSATSWSTSASVSSFGGAVGGSAKESQGETEASGFVWIVHASRWCSHVDSKEDCAEPQTHGNLLIILFMFLCSVLLRGGCSPQFPFLILFVSSCSSAINVLTLNILSLLCVTTFNSSSDRTKRARRRPATPSPRTRRSPPPPRRWLRWGNSATAITDRFRRGWRRFIARAMAIHFVEHVCGILLYHEVYLEVLYIVGWETKQ